MNTLPVKWAVAGTLLVLTTIVVIEGREYMRRLRRSRLEKLLTPLKQVKEMAKPSP